MSTFTPDEVRRYTTTPTQPSSYMVGREQIFLLRAKMRARDPKLTLRRFHDALLGLGGTPPALAGEELVGERMVLPRGTTTAICDPHELANVLGARGIRYFLDAATNARADLRIMMSSCVPSTHHETNGGGGAWPSAPANQNSSTSSGRTGGSGDRGGAIVHPRRARWHDRRRSLQNQVGPVGRVLYITSSRAS